MTPQKALHYILQPSNRVVPKSRYHSKQGCAYKKHNTMLKSEVYINESNKCCNNEYITNYLISCVIYIRFIGPYPIGPESHR